MSRTYRNVPKWKWLRNPRTAGEIRDSEACRVDGIKKRKKRAKRHLPSAWDDQVIAASYEIVEKNLDRGL